MARNCSPRRSNTAPIFITKRASAAAFPIIKSLREGFVGNRITHLYGIVNGTCNYILTRMKLEGADFADVLKDAQAQGYAEAEPVPRHRRPRCAAQDRHPRLARARFLGGSQADSRRRHPPHHRARHAIRRSNSATRSSCWASSKQVENGRRAKSESESRARESRSRFIRR